MNKLRLLPLVIAASVIFINCGNRSDQMNKNNSGITADAMTPDEWFKVRVCMRMCTHMRLRVCMLF